MRSKTNANRLIAFLLAVAMIFSLVIVDSQFGTRAKEEQDKKVSIETLIPEASSATPDKNGKIALDDVDIAVYVAEKDDRVSFTDTKYYLKAITGTDVDSKLATASDAATGIQKAKDFAALEVTEGYAKKLAVYVLKEGNYVFYGLLKVVQDGDAPSVTDVVLVSNETIAKYISGENYYLVKRNANAKFQVCVSDGTKENASGIDKVTYTVGNSTDERNISEVDGKYYLDISATGRYNFFTYDKAGNKSTVKTIDVYVAEGIVVSKVYTTAIPSEVNSQTKFIGGQELFDITVNAYEKAGEKYAGCKLVYTYTFKDGTTFGGSTPLNGGWATITLPNTVLTATGTGENTLVMKVVDDFGDESYAFNENGYIIFVDSKAPDITISNVDLGGGREYTLEEYNALDENEKWAKSAVLDISASSKNSYLADVEYHYWNGETNSYGNINGNTKIDAHTYKKDSMVFGNGGYALKDSSSGGPTEITFAATNCIGKKSDELKFSAYIDNTAPTLNLNSTFLNNEITSESSYFVDASSGETIEVVASDASSGVADISATIKESNEESARVVTLDDNKYTVTESGYYTFTVTVTDRAGNKTTKTANFVIDNSDHVSSLSALITFDDDTTKTITSGNSLVYTGGKSVIVTYTVTGFEITESDIEIKAVKNGIYELPMKKESEVAIDSHTNSIVYTYEIDKNANRQGTYRFEIKSKKHDDNGENPFEKITPKVLEFAYDIEAPGIAEISFKDFVNKVNNTYYYKKNPIISVKAYDNFNIAKYEVKDPDGNVIASDNINNGGVFENDITISNAEKNKKYDVTLFMKDLAGNESNKAATASFVIDTVKPQVGIAEVGSDNNLTPYWNNDSVTLKLTGTDNFVVKSFKAVATCNGNKLEDKTVDITSGASEAQASFRYTKQGIYEVKVYAYDASGNESLAKTCNFVLDKEAPSVEIDGIPDNRLTQGTSVEFSITDEYGINANDVAIVKHYTTYDGTSGQKKLNVSQEDELSVYASSTCDEIKGKAVKYWYTYTITDKSGNTVSDKTTVFYVDATSPSVSITPVPSATNDGYYNKTVKFDIDVSEQFALNHKISIKDKNGNLEEIKESFKDTDYIYTVKSNKQGIYVLSVVVTDAFGNSTTKRVRYTIDKEAPVIKTDAVNDTNNTNVTLGMEFTDNYKGSTYNVHVVRKDASGKVAYEGNVKKGAWTGTSANTELVFSEEGDYLVTVSAKDKAGNTADKKELSFRIDKTAPVLSITGVNDVQNSSVTATMSVDEAFSFAFNNSAAQNTKIDVTITKKTDSTAESTVKTLATGDFSTGNPHTASYTFAEDGEYTITMDAIDASGNSATQMKKTFKVDSKAPVITVKATDKDSRSVESYASVGSDDSDAPNYVDVNVSVEEVFFKTNNVSINVLKDGADASSAYFTNYSNRAEVSNGSQRFEEDGIYNISVTAKDEVGNEAEQYGIVFTVDNTAPSIEKSAALLAMEGKTTSSEDGELLLNASDFADIADKGYEALWQVNDTSVFNVDVKMDGVDFVDFSDLSDGYHKMVITVTDEVGHVSNSEFEFTYDGTAPRIVIQGVENGETVNDPFKLKISLEDAEDIITKIEINGKVIDPSQYEATMTYEMDVKEYDTYKINVEAKDLAGNIASTYDSETDEVFTFALKEKISPIMLIIIIIAVILLIALLVFVIIKNKKRKNSN